MSSRPTKRARTQAPVAARPTKTLRQQVKRIVSGMAETKHLDFLLSSGLGSVGSLNWTELLASFIPAGDADGQRDGSRIEITGFKLHGTVVNGWTASTGGDAYNTMRLVVYEAAQGYAAGGNGPLRTMGSTMSVAIRPDSVTGVVRLLHDEWIPLNPGYGDANATFGTAGGPLVVPVSFFIKLKKPITIDYATTAADTGNKGLWVCAISDSAAVPNPGFTFGYYTVYYKDL